jgi:hypothetical protein
MRARSFLAALGCAGALALAGTGTASADSGAKPTQRPSTGAVARPTARPAETAAPAAGDGSRTGADRGQVHAVPRGAADTGVPPVASGSGSSAGGTAAGVAGGVLVLGAGVFAVRRRQLAARG